MRLIRDEFCKMSSFEFFIAKRIYSDSDGKKHFSRPAIRIAMAGVAIGVAVMIVSLSVVLGFKDEVSAKVIGFGSHAQIVSRTIDADYEVLPVIADELLMMRLRDVDGVKRVQTHVSKLGMLKTDEDFCGMNFRGVDSTYDMSFFADCLVDGTMPKFSDSEASNQLLISESTAKSLKLSVGDKVFAYFLSSNNMRARRFEVVGIYNTNLTEYDKTIAFTDIYTMRRLNGWESDMVTSCEIEADNLEDMDFMIYDLARIANTTEDRNGTVYGAFTTKELNPHIFSWLDVLDTNVVMILVLMICVASVTVISGLLIIILERINMIGILKSLGATDMRIRKIFMHFAIFLVGKGLLIGNVAGIIVCLIQKYGRLVKLDASVYYIDTVPIKFNWLYILGINLLTLLISSIVIFGASFLISINKPAKTLRFE